jgi:hypothetical protein
MAVAVLGLADMSSARCRWREYRKGGRHAHSTARLLCWLSLDPIRHQRAWVATWRASLAELHVPERCTSFG